MASYTIDQRQMGVRLYKQLGSLQKAADKIGCWASTIYNWVMKDKKKKSLASLPTGGSYTVNFLGAHLHFIAAKIKLEGADVGHARIAELLLAERGVQCDQESVRRLRARYDLPRKTRSGDIVGSFDAVAGTDGVPAAAEPAPAAVAETAVSKRVDLVTAVEAGTETVKQACERLKVEKPTAYKWIAEFRRDKKLKAKPRGGDKRSIDLSPFADDIRAKAADGQSDEEIAQWLTKERGVKCSRTTVYRFRKRDVADRGAAQAQAQAEAKAAAADLARQVEKLLRRSGIPLNQTRLILTAIQGEWHIFRDCYASVTDGRQGNALCHGLPMVLFIAYLASMVGMDRGTGAARYAEENWELLSAVLGESAPKNPPSASTINRLLRQVDETELEKAAARYFRDQNRKLELPEEGLRFFMDGKSMKGSADGGGQETVTVSVIEHTRRVTYAVVRGGRLAKEWKAGLRMIEEGMFPVKGNTVIADGLYGQQAFAQAIIDRGGDYKIVLRENRKSLYNDVKMYLDTHDRDIVDSHRERDGKRPWVLRETEVLNLPDSLLQRHKFPGLSTVATYKVTHQFPAAPGGQIPTAAAAHDPDEEEEYRILMLSDKNTTAELFMRDIRVNWGGEENHHILDVTFSEDGHTSRKGAAPVAYAVARRMALNHLLGADLTTTTKGIIERIRLNPWAQFALATGLYRENEEIAEQFKHLNESYKGRRQGKK